MKIREVIQEFVPCEICGNNDIKNFYFHVLPGNEDNGSKPSVPYVKCCECEEEYYSASARKILEAHKDQAIKAAKALGLKDGDGEHPLVKTLQRYV